MEKTGSVKDFFGILFSRFFKLIKFNLFYLVCVLPLLCLLVSYIATQFKLPEDLVVGIPIIRYLLILSMKTPNIISLILVVASIILFGPLNAGFTYVVRNYVRRDHVWGSDFWQHAFGNFWQSFTLGLIDIIVFASFLLYMTPGILETAGTLTPILGVLRYVFYFLIFIYLFMRFYSYTMIITFELSIIDVLKNSLIFAFLGVFRNIFALLLVIIATYIISFVPLLDIVLILTCWFSLLFYIPQFLTYPLIKKHMFSDKKED